MQFFVVFALAFSTVSAFDLHHANRPVPFRDIVMPTELVMDGRISNGQNAATGQFPWQCSLESNKRSCSCTLISPTWVLTAAHCVAGAESFTIGCGSNIISHPEVTRKAVISDAVIHSGWNSNTMSDDIALIRIDAISETATIKSVKLPAIGNIAHYTGNTAITSGWGKTSDNSGVSNQLQYTDVTVISNTDCRRLYGSNVRAGTICVSTAGGKSTCNGDSGAPLLLAEDKIQIGIASFGSAFGCTRGDPAAFTRVSAYREFINKHTGV